ncbi:MAG: SUMF1/EgtB/PvdO family nonheme iron enzyme [Phycisphaerales bacterium]|nr:SUMF1/EgtB/PvdO family nonheme iron enzyme [Phycisphaerales bacterium]
MQTLVYIVGAALSSPASLPSERGDAVRCTQPVAGTALSIELIRMPAPPDSPPLWISRDEISWDLYDALVYQLDVPKGGDEPAEAVTRPTKPYLMADRGWGHAGYPALSVSHRGATAFCEWMSRKTGKRWRLPTVEEWKRLCAASGVTSSNQLDHAWQSGNAENKTHAIGTRAPDANGLNDLCGNVSEWCVDGPDQWVLMGTCYKDATGDPCAVRKEPGPEWNDTDPQIPKSIWWLSDAPFAGFRVVCEEVASDTGLPQQKNEEASHVERPAE